MREIGQHRGDIPESDRLVGSVDAFGELVQSQPTVTARGLQDFDDPFTVLVGQANLSRATLWRGQRHVGHCAR
jgi:hypothetical protein